ncbi:putative aminoacyl-tRNA hydrolase [Helianthus annuus]|uniref:Aminoacyl-tRNA hydrolase n=1 Tax=Helianthus annuus TaxID=4232 RepID=A0A9K3GXY0_HELAN|nr:putative aminoacyl-tRNA hydrolase [Helianthus annuus]
MLFFFSLMLLPFNLLFMQGRCLGRLLSPNKQPPKAKFLRKVGPLAAYYQVPLRHILLVYDEMSLPNHVLRLQPRGGHGYHNGLVY